MYNFGMGEASEGGAREEKMRLGERNE